MSKLRTGRMLAAACAALWMFAGAGASAAPLVIKGEEIASSELYEAAKKEGQLTVYSSLSGRPYGPIRKAFEADTGIKINYIGLITPKLYQRALSEHSAGKLSADYLDLTDLTLVQDLIEKGVLGHAYKVPAFDRIDPALKDPEGRWYSLLRNITVLGVNTALVPENEWPKAWKDMLDPKWQGRIGLFNIDVGGSAFSNFSYLRERIAPDFWARLAAQKPRIYPSAAPTVTDLVRGEVSLIMASTASLIEQVVSGAPVKIIFPAEGNPGFPTAGGITASAKNVNAARLYLAWLTSKRGGEAMGASALYGAHPEAPPPSPEGIKFPEVDKIWTLKIDEWVAKRDSYTTEWQIGRAHV